MKMKKNINMISIISVVFILLSISVIPLFFSGRYIVKAEYQFSSTYTITFEQPTFSTIQVHNDSNYLEVFVPDCMLSAETGNAMMPVYAAHILIPEGCIIEDIQIEDRMFTDYSHVLHDAILMPAQEEIPFSEMNQASHLQLQQTRNQSWYDQTDFQPTTSFQSLGIGYMRGYPIKTIHLYPLRYHPSAQLLWFYAELRITVTFSYEQEPLSPSSRSTRSTTSAVSSSATVSSAPVSANQFYRGKSSDLERVKDLVVNHEMLYSYPLRDDASDGSGGGIVPLGGGSSSGSSSAPLGETYPGGLCDPVDTYEYVIITSENLADIQDQAYNWSDLMDHRKQHDGLNGIIVTVEEIYSCEAYWNTTVVNGSMIFNDSAALVREFVKDAYLSWDTEYVLLGGSWQTSGTDYEHRQIVPARIFTSPAGGYSVTRMASDLYFSNLDEDWYHQYDEENDWHEWGGGISGNNDGLSELAVGRIPIWTAEHVSNWIEKVLWYDTYDNEDWLRSTAFLGAYLGDHSITSKDYMEALRLGDGFYSQFTGFEEWNTAFPEYELNTLHRYYEADYPGEDGTGPDSRHRSAVDDWEGAINNNNFSIISHVGHGSRLSTLNMLDGRYLTNDNYFIGTSQACHSGRFTTGESGATTFTSKWNDRGGSFAMILNTAYGFYSPTTTSGSSQYQHKVWWDYFFNEEADCQSNWQLGKAMQYTKDNFYPLITNSWSRQYVWYSWNLFGDPAQQLRITLDGNIPPTISSPDPVDAATDVSLDLTQLSVFITDADGDLLDWTIQTSPNIGSSSGNNEGNGTKTCSITGLLYDTTYTWFVNASDGTSWTNESFMFTTKNNPNNQPPIISNPNPANGSIDVDVNLKNLSVHISNPNGESFSYTIEGCYIENDSQNNKENGTKTVEINEALPHLTVITWFVNVTDGHHWTRKSYQFTTGLPDDDTPPEIANVKITTSDPMDTDPSFGWENLSCSVTDNIEVATVWACITFPDLSTTNESLTQIADTDIWFFNSSFSLVGNYSFIVYATDVNGNMNHSEPVTLSLAPNWDITLDGRCGLLDLNAISNNYGLVGPPGWIREDVNNDGKITVLDLVIVSEHYGEVWWD